ncbi:MAG: hypothetical protein J2P27_09120 [Actinobacteria bacterium]|nr:hypothetical protein [Actinomycetota bacterium]
MILFLELGLLLVACVLAPFAWGLMRGPQPLARPVTAKARRAAAGPMRPLGTIAGIYGRFLLLYIAFVVWGLKDGAYSDGGRPGQVCVNTAVSVIPPGGNQTWGPVAPGTSMAPAMGTFQGCVLHPSVAQWALFGLTQLPSLLLWGLVLLMILRLVRHAAMYGPFNPRSAVTMAQLGWLIIGGCVIVGVLKSIGTDLITDMIMRPRPYGAVSIANDALVHGALRTLLPVPALAGVALLTFASMTRVGAAMDEELQATI